ncbi:MAG TPA: isochorismatase family protein [Pseudonocardiaceae bacterium]|nr:isochorismatase family protein [Pseudonocardiaceae bacterium]
MHWNDFLTEQDTAVPAATSWAKQEPFGLGARPAVVVVDLYYAALGLPRADILDSVADWPSSCGLDGWAAVDRTAGVLATARAAGAKVIYLHATPPELGRWHRKPAKRLATRSDGLDPNDIVAEAAPRADDIVLTKIGPSAFHQTPLDTILRSGGYDTVLVCGEATSGCVRSTVVDGCVAGYRVGVVGDCCFDRFEASYHVSLFDSHMFRPYVRTYGLNIWLNQRYADVITADETETYLRTCDSHSTGAA